MSVSVLKYQKVYPQSGSQSLTIDSSPQQLVFEVPPVVWKAKPSYLSFTLGHSAQTADNLLALHAKGIPLFTRLEVYTANKTLEDINNCDILMAATERALYSKEAFAARPRALCTPTAAEIAAGRNYDAARAVDPFGAGPLSCCVGGGSVTADVMEITNRQAADGNAVARADLAKWTDQQKNMYGRSFPLNNGALYTPCRPKGSLMETDNDVAFGCRYIVTGSSHGAVDNTKLNVQVDLGHFVDSLLSSDAHLCFNQALYIRLTTAPVAQVAFQQAVRANNDGLFIEADPAGTNHKISKGVNIFTPAAAVAIGAVTLSMSSICLNLAVERNLDIVRQVQAEAMSGVGRSLVFSSAKQILMQNFATAAANTITARIGNNSGIALKRLYFAAFHGTRSGHTSFNNDNTGRPGTVEGSKITSFYTQIDGNRVQNQDLVVATCDDYREMHKLLEGSSLAINQDTYKANHLWVENFEDETVPLWKQIEMGGNSRIGGLPLTKELMYQLTATQAYANSVNYYLFGVFSRRLVVRGTEVSLE